MLYFILTLLLLFTTSCAPPRSKLDNTNLNNAEVISFRKEDLLIAKNIKVTKQPVLINKPWFKSYTSSSSDMQSRFLPKLNDFEKHRFHLDSSLNYPSNPVITDDSIFMLEAGGILKSLKVNTLEVNWNAEILDKSFIRNTTSGGGLSYHDGFVYATGGSNEVLKINAKDGAIVWRKRLDSIFRSVPVVAENRYVVVQSVDNSVYTLDNKTGDLVWMRSGIASAELITLKSYVPIVDKKKVIVNSTPNIMTAFELDTGKMLWERDFSSGYLYNTEDSSEDYTLPIYNEEKIFFAPQMSFAMVIDTEGKILWQKDIPIQSTAWVAGEFIYALLSQDRLAAIHFATGDIKWITKLHPKDDDDSITLWTSPVLTNSGIIVLNDKGELHTFDPETGIGSFGGNIDKLVYNAPIIANKSLYIISNQGNLTKFFRKKF